MKDKRYIEESFPVKEVSEISAREKNIDMGIYQPYISGGLVVHWQVQELQAMLR